MAEEGGPGWDKVVPLLDKHCSRCHQAGKTTGKFKDKPADDFGFVLDETKLITRNKLVLGNADASQIFVKVQKGDMPKDIDDACYDGSATATTYCGLSKDEVVLLHDAINALKPPSIEPTPLAAAAPAPAVATPATAPSPTPNQTAALTTPPPAPAGPAQTAAAAVPPAATVPDPAATPPAAPPAPSVATPATEPSPAPSQATAVSAPPAPPAPAAPAQTAAAAVPPAATVPAPPAPVAPPAPAVATPPVPASPAPSQTAAVAPAPAPAAPTPAPAASESAPPAPVAQAFISDTEVIRAISEDASKATDTDRPNLRYFTLTHFYNAGEPEKDMRVYRMALSKLLNSLSTEADPVTPMAVDPAQTIYRVDISRLGWTKATWDNIAANDPYVIFYHNAQFRALQSDLKTVVPFMRADWFTFAASRPPLYYDILKLPKTKQELQKLIGADVQHDFALRHVERAAFQKSGVSDNNRMVERHTIPAGMYWESYDFGSNGDRKSLFQFPFGPPGAFGDLSKKLGFEQDGGEIIWTLPNGFHAYYLTTGKGDRLDTGPTKIVHDPAQRDLSVTDGISCMGCHDKGIKFNDFRPGQPLDQVRDIVLKSGSFSPEAKEIAAQIFPVGDAFDKRMQADLKRYAESLGAAGVNVNVKDDGVEMVNALSRRFEDNLNAKLAAAEVGMEPEAFMERLNAAGGQAYDLKLRLQQDVVPRDQFVAIFAKLVNTINDEGDKAIDLTKLAQKSGTTVAAVTSATAQPTGFSKSFDLAFYANATSFKVGDYVTFTLQSQQPCFLTILDADDKGRSTILFPNAHHPDGKIEAGVTTQVPGPQIGGFQIHATEAGTERITATCNASFDQNADLDFSKAQFATFDSTRALLSAQADTRLRQQEAVRKRLLAIEAAQPAVASSDPGLVSKEVNPDALIPNVSDPHIPITAQKSVVLQIRGH